MAFGYYKSVTLDHTQCGATDSTNWPLAIALDGNVQAADADLKSVGNGGYVQSASGYDIRPYADSALTSPLAFELVFYDPTTGNLEMHVKIPTLSHTSDTVIYLAFGDSGLTTDGSSSSTWNSNFDLVMHMPNGSSLTLLDSTSNGRNGTNVNSVAAAAGQMDGGASFNGSNRVSLPAFAWGAPFVVSAWVKPSNTAQVSMFVSKKPGVSDEAVQFFMVNADLFGRAFDTGSGNFIGRSAPSVLTTAFQLIALAYDGGTTAAAIKLYRNGSQVDTTDSNGGSFSSFNDDATYASEIASQNSGGNILTGVEDEVRIIGAATSADWLLSDYNSQKASSTFIAWGARTATSPSSGTITSMLQLMGVG